MTELKPCPFCGGEARIITVGMFYHCECDNCCAASDHATNKEYAITLWNKRSNPWHTGTPTEYGLYLVQYTHEGYDVVLYDPSASGWDIYSDDSPKDIVGWREI